MPTVDLEVIAFALHVAYRQPGEPAWSDLSREERQDWIRRTRLGLDAAMVSYHPAPVDDAAPEGDGLP